jgi:hypothetical protein
MPVGRHATGARMLGKMPFVRTEGINPSAHCGRVVEANSTKWNFNSGASGKDPSQVAEVN